MRKPGRTQKNLQVDRVEDVTYRSGVPNQSGPWPVRKWTTQPEVSGRPAIKASSVFAATPQC